MEPVASDIAQLEPQHKPFKMSNGGDQRAAGLLEISN